MPIENGQPITSSDENEVYHYHAPRVVELGSTNTLIRGNWGPGHWDNGSFHYYIMGE